MFQPIDKWHKTKLGHVVFGAAELVLAYSFISLALDSAHFWQYALAIIFLVGGLQNLARIFRSSKNG